MLDVLGIENEFEAEKGDAGSGEMEQESVSSVESGGGGVFFMGKLESRAAILSRRCCAPHARALRPSLTCDPTFQPSRASWQCLSRRGRSPRSSRRLSLHISSFQHVGDYLPYPRSEEEMGVGGHRPPRY